MRVLLEAFREFLEDFQITRGTPVALQYGVATVDRAHATYKSEMLVFCAGAKTAANVCPATEEEEDFTSLANQLGCTDGPGLSITWSKTSVLSVYHV